jgi:signal transduction histidine kinase
MRPGMKLWPQGLLSRAMILLTLGFALVQGVGLYLHTIDRSDLLRLGQAREVAASAMAVYRAVVVSPPDGGRAALLRGMNLPPGTSATLLEAAPAEMLPAPLTLSRLIQADLTLSPVPFHARPRDVVVLGSLADGVVQVGLALPEHGWLAVTVRVPAVEIWRSPLYFAAYLGLCLLALFLAWLLLRRLIAPFTALTSAAETLGRDVNAPPIAEAGPREIGAAAAAFNLMASRLRRFVQDRTFLLTAIGHDLRTPITRLKLRAEFLEDDDMRRKILADLDEMEAMLSATLMFGRDAAASERTATLDLVALIRTVLDEAADAAPECAERLTYAGPERLLLTARPIALKRALANLIANAMKYGDGAAVRLRPPADHLAVIEIEDRGPGIPDDDMERVFQPFQRLEASRNRETGGSGLGLPIARNILRAHGGDVTLTNRPGGGLRVIVSLPV